MPTSRAPSPAPNVTDPPWDSRFDFASQSPTWTNSVLKMALISLIVCVSLFGNVVVLLVFQRKPQLLHVANRFVLNLLLADLLQTVLVMPFAIAATVPGVWPLDARLCQALVVLMHLFAFAGVNTIMVVSVDRYLAIIHPLSYPTRMTPHLGTNLIACTWLLSLLQSTPPLYGWGAIDFNRHHEMCSVVWSYSLSYSVVVATFSFWLPVLVMLGCYWMVFRAARRQNALVHPVRTRSYSQPCPQDFQGPQPQQASTPDKPYSAARVRHRRFRYHCKAARVVFVIMASYILSMGPYSVLNTISMSARADVPPWLSSLALVLFFLQCCLHPYIYGYMHRSVRKEFLAFLCGMLCKQGRPGQSSAADTCLTAAAGEGRRSGAPAHLPGLAARVFPLQTWEECTTSSSPTFERRSRDSRKDTTSTSVSSDRELTVHGKQSRWCDPRSRRLQNLFQDPPSQVLGSTLSHNFWSQGPNSRAKRTKVCLLSGLYSSSSTRSL
ncbi:probable G-protein coupled receptor 101 [Entelurus aequoreus]|uniref:probable G-protein coupled receptor 101 n=1 Tax=Entelurus aequoreus TaxID=161455 RepID=UPI002B1DE963|nr:probable G-protein coupled receptor 101 [Entelurus aequoreus]